jgi:chemotaxis protein MotC
VRRRASRTSAVLAIALLGSPAFGEDADGLVQSSRQLQRAHVAMAQGDSGAIAAQRRILMDMATRIAANSGKNVADVKQDRAVVSYLLSGGPPEPVVALLSNNRLPENEDRLVRGALAYVLGRRDAAAQLLANIDPKTLDPSIAGEIAFAQSVVENESDKQKSLQSLDEARLLSPGGLVEEAALRREVVVAAKLRDFARFYLLSRQYLERFQSSIYAPEFMKKLEFWIVAYDLVRDKDSLDRLAPVLRWYPPTEATRIRLSIARAATLNGRLELADVAAERVLASTSATEAMKVRARLYQGAAKTLSDAYGDGTAELANIDPSTLDEADRDLLGAARETALRVHQFADVSSSAIAAETGGSPTIDAANSALSEAQTVLAEK